MTSEEWLRWIFEAELPLAPEAMKFFLAGGGYAWWPIMMRRRGSYYTAPSGADWPEGQGGRAPKAEAGMPHLDVVANGIEYGSQTYTQLFTLAGPGAGAVGDHRGR